MSRKFKSGVLSVTFRSLAPEAVVKLTAETGLEGIEWGGDVHAPAGKTRVAEQIRRWTTEAGLEVSAYGSYYKFEELEENASEKGPEMEAVLDTAEALGASMIRIWPGSVGSAEATPAWRRAVAERTREFAEAAAPRGLRLGFEFHDHSLTDTAESTLELLDAINHASVSTFWQTNRSGGHELALAGLKEVRERVSNVHCHHLVDYVNPPFELLEKGEAEWRQYLKLLAETGEERWVSIEFVREGSEDAFRRDAATLRRWVSTY